MEKKNKLTPKKSITSFVSEIRNEQVIQPKEKEEIQEAEKPKKVQTSENIPQWLKEIKEVEEDIVYNEVIYIEENVKDIFKMLKTNAGINISKITSYVLTKWIEENIEDIKNLTKKSNKFLD